MRSTALILTLLAAPALAIGSDPGVPRIVIDRDLQERDRMVVALDDHRLQYRDGTGILRTEPATAVFALTTPPASDPRQPARGTSKEDDGAIAGVLEIIDGQRFVGSLAATSAEGAPAESIHWEHPLLGAIAFTLDDVRKVTFDTAVALPSGDGIGDVIILRNGDRLEGFVEAVGALVRIETDAQPREVPIDRIAHIVLANPSQPLTGRAAWLSDGTVVACSGLGEPAEGVVRLILRGGPTLPRASAAQAATVPLGDLLALAFEAETLAPLASLPVVAQRPAEGRRWTPPIRLLGPTPALLGAADIEFPGPMTVEWELPEGAARFAATAELPESMWNWGDCELSVSILPGGQSGEEERLFHARMNAENWFEQIRLDLRPHMRDRGPRRLRVHIDPGKHGPIQDRIILRMPLLSVEPQRG